MKTLLFTSLLLFSFFINAQNTFDDGWKEGFESVMLDYGKSIYIVPTSPIVMANESNTYRAGFRRGYNRGLKKLHIANPNYTWKEAYIGIDGIKCDKKKTKLTFDDGWDAGYSDAMEDHDKSIFIIPISPIVMGNQDNYSSGYRKGYRKGLKDLK